MSHPSRKILPLESLPVLPLVAAKLNELTENPSATLTKVSTVLAHDPVMAARVLRLANSSYYSIPGGVRDLFKAVSYLGLTTLTQMVLGLSIGSVFKGFGTTYLRARDFWTHSVGVAVAAQEIAIHQGLSDPTRFFSCGLLHDLGKLIFFKTEPRDFEGVLKTAHEEKLSFTEAEIRHQRPTHEELGAELARHWGLPEEVVHAIREHHQPWDSQWKKGESLKQIQTVVGVSNDFARALGLGSSGNFSKPAPLENILTILHCKPSDLEGLATTIRQKIDQSGEFIRELTA